LLTQRVPIERRDEGGELRHDIAWLVDWERSKGNDFVVIHRVKRRLCRGGIAEQRRRGQAVQGRGSIAMNSPARWPLAWRRIELRGSRLHAHIARHQQEPHTDAAMRCTSRGSSGSLRKPCRAYHWPNRVVRA
jgi:hypothetical protein